MILEAIIYAILFWIVSNPQIKLLYYKIYSRTNTFVYGGSLGIWYSLFYYTINKLKTYI